MPEKQTPPNEPKKDLPGRLSRDFSIHKHEMFAGGEENMKYPARQCSVLHIRSKLNLETIVNSALFHFTRGLVLRNAIQ
jgi:hypothetical protein